MNPPYHQIPAVETDALLERHRHVEHESTKPPYIHHLTSEIDPRWGDLLLLFCYIITGLLDSSAVSIWGSFVSMQTGNTVYLGLGLAGLDSGRWIKSLISIGSFCIGSFCFATFHRFFPPRQRWVLSFSFLTQMTCIAVAAIIVTMHPSTKDELSWKVAVPLSLVAFQSSGQAVTSRVLDFTSLTSVVLTSIYCDLFSNLHLPVSSTLRNSDEWRRLGAIACFLTGTLIGGIWAKSDAGLVGALWTAVVFKGLIAAVWLGWRKQE
ncbi:hypothetical protein ASPWEDRAFT_45632 [Aspergillus wentii DTO 134E9]|uniref:DUF1275 domain protein n=1 Tax=Aspergillus wentii DTO 134E9 TaxID=1073089 RepID=A0A1L9R9W1_ASPWE|nr:uncharacterized protein ASPWEDRAFT_45632 [Aspergillus wentii DTO 134E9]KAI9926306.1 hypothetical protein MW887_004070 [Aspergillus wentii]OJJ31663.1 hypothetical protein ASPWEDRAFT_45632 [Aspergillus wentii DTO 134E9]